MKLIDGSALEKAVASYIFEDAKLSIPQLLKNGDLLMVCEIISHFPAVDAVPDRHGKWTGYAGTVGAECSICHAWLDVLQGTAEMNYCPNCGARMVEDDQID